jgi:hypothetical protein
VDLDWLRMMVVTAVLAHFKFQGDFALSENYNIGGFKV